MLVISVEVYNLALSPVDIEDLACLPRQPLTTGVISFRPR